MGNRRQPVKKASKGGSFVLIVLAIGLITFVAWMNWPEKVKESFTTVQTQDSKQYSSEEMHQFWDFFIKPILGKLVGGIYPLQEIREHYDFLLSGIQKRYGQPFILETWPTYYEASKNIGGGNRLVNGKPTIAFIVPVFMNQYSTLQATYPNDFSQRFEVLVVSTFLHEAEHLVLDEENPNQNKQAFLQAEGVALAETCSKVLAVFVYHGYALSFADNDSYTNWTSCGRASNACWRKYVESLNKEAMELLTK